MLHDECERRHDLEISDGSNCERADALHIVAMTSDADDECCEQHRHDQRFDHPQKHVRQNFDIRGMKRVHASAVRKEITEHQPDNDRDDDPLRLRDRGQATARRRSDALRDSSRHERPVENPENKRDRPNAVSRLDPDIHSSRRLFGVQSRVRRGNSAGARSDVRNRLAIPLIDIP
jgi:hypothetical protein